VVVRFGHGSQERQIEAKELVGFVEWARAATVHRLLVNGSFVTDVESPNDVDVVILPSLATLTDPRYGQIADAVWPFLHIFVAVDDPDFDRWAEDDFAADRRGRRKGVVELLL
jgi:hypothetical protein